MDGDFPFAIDLVYLWVDGSDEEFSRCKAAHENECGSLWANTESRFADCDELRYSLRSVHAFAPWVRRVHIVTNGQVPAWLNLRHPSIRVVTHEQIFPRRSHLPTFSPLAIECHLHRIPELAEHFLFANDDMFFGSPASPEAFFDADGTMRVSLQLRYLSTAPTTVNSQMPGRNAARLLSRIFGNRPRRVPRHQIKPFTKSLFKAFDLQFPRLLESMSSHRFRHDDDIYLTYVFAPHYALQVGLGVRCSRGGVLVTIGDDAERNRSILERILKGRPPLFCVNDSTSMHREMLRSFFSDYFPTPSPFEVQVER